MSQDINPAPGTLKALGFERKDGFYYLNCAITLALMFLFPRLSPLGEMTPMGMQVLAFFWPSYTAGARLI